MNGNGRNKEATEHNAAINHFLYIGVSQNQAFISLYASSNNLEAVWPKYLLVLTITATYSFVRIQRFIKILVPCLFGNILFGATTPNAG